MESGMPAAARAETMGCGEVAGCHQRFRLTAAVVAARADAHPLLGQCAFSALHRGRGRLGNDRHAVGTAAGSAEDAPVLQRSRR